MVAGLKVQLMATISKIDDYDDDDLAVAVVDYDIAEMNDLNRFVIVDDIQRLGLSQIVVELLDWTFAL